MAAAVGVRGWCELAPGSGPRWLLSFSALLSVAARGALATTHWVVTEDGKIQQQVAARASLRARPRPGGFPGLAPGFGSARPRPRPTFPRAPRGGPGAPSAAAWRRPSPLGGRGEVRSFAPRGRALRGPAGPAWGRGPRDQLPGLGARNHLFLNPASASLGPASPALPEEVESRWRRWGALESQGSDS